MVLQVIIESFSEDGKPLKALLLGVVCLGGVLAFGFLIALGSIYGH